jgi:hypothetical protein
MVEAKSAGHQTFLVETYPAPRATYLIDHGVGVVSGGERGFVCGGGGRRRRPGQKQRLVAVAGGGGFE